jgi:hypothetical protein
MTLVSRLTRSIAAVSLLALPLSAQTVRHRAAAQPPKETVTLFGTVRDAQTGQPIAGATVSADNRHSAVTKADGAYLLQIAKGINVTVVAEQSAYFPQTQSVFGQDHASLDFALSPKPTVTLHLTNGETWVLDIDSAQFAYVIPFSGYVHGDVANFCRDDGTAFTPNKRDIAKVIGPAQPVNFAPCCTLGPVMKVTVQMKNGDTFPVYFNDSCFGYEVDFLGRDKNTSVYQYFRFTDITEVDFP